MQTSIKTRGNLCTELGPPVNYRELIQLAVRAQLLVACSKRSDSGERCEVKKAIKSRGGLGREVPSLTSPPPPGGALSEFLGGDVPLGPWKP